jgi:hypothetical protein
MAQSQHLALASATTARGPSSSRRRAGVENRRVWIHVLPFRIVPPRLVARQRPRPRRTAVRATF